MIATISNILKKDIVKIFSLNAVSTLIRMLSGFLSVKVVAVLIGPSGIALLGQLNNFSSIFLTLSTGGINNGVTKYLAEYSKTESKVAIFLRTAIWITAALSVLNGLLLILGAKYFSIIVLKDVKYSPIIFVFGCTIIFFSFNGLFLSILNGFKEFKKYVTVNIISSILGLVFSAILALSYGVYGALLSAVTFQSVVFIVTLTIVAKSPWFTKVNLIGKFSKTAGKKLALFSIMALISAATMPVSQLIIRTYITEYTSLTDAGLWEGMNRISGIYLMVVTSSLTIYYLPRLSEINEKNELKIEILNTYKIILPPLCIISLIIYLFRSLIINILFDDEFQGMQNLFAFQLIGDVFKISSWILAFLMVAKAMTKKYVINEIGFSIIFVSISIFLVKSYGTIGATIGYAITYFIYFIAMIFVFRKVLLQKKYAK